MSTLAHLRAHRARLRAGKRMFRPVLDVVAVEELLRAEDLLGPYQDDPVVVEAAFQKFLDLLLETGFASGGEVGA